MNYRNEKEVHGTWVKFYYSDDYHEWMPGINVKCYWYPRTVDLFPEMDDNLADKLGEIVWERSVELFWRDAQLIADRIWGDNKVTVRCCGRSGGWCCLYGLSDYIQWNKRTVKRWATFEAEINQLVKLVTSPEYVKNCILEEKQA